MPEEVCDCPGCWACKGNVPGCVCAIDWDAIAERQRDSQHERETRWTKEPESDMLSTE